MFMVIHEYEIARTLPKCDISCALRWRSPFESQRRPGNPRLAVLVSHRVLPREEQKIKLFTRLSIIFSSFKMAIKYLLCCFLNMFFSNMNLRA